MNIHKNVHRLPILSLTIITMTLMAVAPGIIGCSPPNTGSSGGGSSSNLSSTERLVGVWTIDKEHKKESLLAVGRKRKGRVTSAEIREVEQRLRDANPTMEYKSDGTYFGTLVVPRSPNVKAKPGEGTWKIIDSDDGNQYIVTEKEGSSTAKHKIVFHNDDVVDVIVEAFRPDEDDSVIRMVRVK